LFELFVSGELLNDAVLDLVDQDLEAYFTALALRILEEIFGDRYDEWVLIAEKGEEFLKSKQLKPFTVIDAFPDGFLA